MIGISIKAKMKNNLRPGRGNPYQKKLQKHRFLFYFIFYLKETISFMVCMKLQKKGETPTEGIIYNFIEDGSLVFLGGILGRR